MPEQSKHQPGPALLLAPVGAGKTETAIHRLTGVLHEQPFARVWVLLASDRQIHDFRQRMIASQPDQRVFFNVSFFNFYSLYAHLLDSASQPQRCLDETARIGLLRRILATLPADDPLAVFAPIGTTPGFTRIAADFIYELKQNLVGVAEFSAAAHNDKDRDLARLYARYQARLREHDLVDREGEGWLALSELAAHPDLWTDVDLLIVDGYDQFTPLQARLLALLAARAHETLITLTTVPGREQTIGKRFTRARERLRQTFAAEGQALNEHTVTDGVDDRHPVLRHLVEQIFQREPTQTTANGVAHFIEAPDINSEVSAVLRRVKRLLLAGTPPDHIVIALRDLHRYLPYFAALAGPTLYNLPLALQYRDPLHENPAVVALLDLLNLAHDDFRRRTLLDVLQSAYFVVPGFDAAAVAQLDRVSQVFRVTGGRDAWLDALERAAQVNLLPANDEDDDTDAKPLLAPDEAARLRQHLSAFFDHVTPPQQHTVFGYIEWLEDLIGPDPEQDADDADDPAAGTDALQMIARVREAALPGVVERDLAALDEFKRLLRAMLSHEGLLAALDLDSEVEWADWLADLRAAVTGAVIERSPSRSGRVLVTTVTDARGLPHPHVFIAGLAEGVFPLKQAEDPLYLDSERAAWAERGIPLQTRAERADDDGLFYELISLARQSLTLSRPYITKGEPWPASHLWRGALGVFSDDRDKLVQRVALDAVVSPKEAATVSEATVAVLANPADAAAEAVRSWLAAEHTALWQRIQQHCRYEQRRLSAVPHDHFSGRLHHPDLIAWVAGRLGPQHVWSASQLNEFGTCAFRFFAKRLLRLDTFEEPEDGLDSRQMGKLNHEILEKTYQQIRDHDLAITPENTDDALAIFETVADDVFAAAPAHFGFHEAALWQQEAALIRRQLKQLITLDFSGSGVVDKAFKLTPRRVYAVEAPFGSNDRRTVRLELAEGMPSLRVTGVIDRIDRVGDAAIIIDYKTGSTQISPTELARGRNFQMMLYLLAAQNLLDRADDAPVQVEGGLFWHVRTGEAKGKLRFDDEGSAAMQTAREKLAVYLTQMRAGDFAAEPTKRDNGRCVSFCEYHHLCRISITHPNKPPASPE